MSATQTKDEDLQTRVADKAFSDREVREYLDSLEYRYIVARFGDPVITTHYAEVPGWRPGDGRPVLASEDPAVMAAIGRCASWRQRERLPGPQALPGWVHPAECGWCSYPLAELLTACAWSVWHSRHVLSEVHAWLGKDGSVYARGGRSDVYENPAWAEFAALTPAERTTRVLAAVEASL